MTPRSQLDIYLDQLAETHGFTLEQLAENRAARLHPTQVERFRSSGFGAGLGCLGFAVLVLFGAIGGAFALYMDFSHGGNDPVGRVDLNGIKMLGGGGTLLSLVMVAFAISIFNGVKKRRALYDKGQVWLVQGPIHKIHVRRNKGGDSFLYELQGRRFNVRHAGWKAVTQGMPYKLYFLGDDFLSIEPA